MTITPQDLVNREVETCLSYLVATVASAYGYGGGSKEINELAEQAFELAAPIDDWEEAAIQEGWIKDGAWHGYNHDEYPNWLAAETNGACSTYDTAQEACEANDIDPYQREVFEHWAVSSWLADKLEAHGEKVDKDFAGLCVWARTTTGQAIYADGVIEAICAEVNNAQ